MNFEETPAWVDNLKLAIHQALSDNPQHLKATAIEDRMNLPHKFLYRYGDLKQSAMINLERLVQLTLISGDTRPMAALCRAVGGVFLHARPLEQGKEMLALKAVKEFSELMSEYSKDVRDGKICAKELARLDREAMQAQLAIAGLLQAARDNYSKSDEGGI